VSWSTDDARTIFLGWDSVTPREAAVESIRRMKEMWPAWSWSKEMEREYGLALMDAGGPEFVEAGTTLAIRECPGKYPPPLADLLQRIERCRMQAAIDRPRRQADVSITAAALEDAINALDYAKTDEERAFVQGQITALRSRLSDRGAQTDERMRSDVRFVLAPHRYDPEGTIRFAIHRPGEVRHLQAVDDVDS
jgi:hypothetical protein